MSKKVYTSLIWSSIDKFSVVIIQLILDIILARILSPSEFGIIAILMVFVTFSQLIIDSGLSNSLIHFKDRNSDVDYSSIFTLNIIVGIILYLVICLSADFISNFYDLDLNMYIRIFCISILFNSISIIYKTKLSIDINFKVQAKFSLFSILLASIISIYLAINNYGVWALISLYLSQTFFNMLFLILNSKWVPKLILNRESILRNFNYGYKLMIAAVLNSFFVNFYTLFIGRFYNANTLGTYSKAYQLSLFPASVFTISIQRVLFPNLVSLKNDFETLAIKINQIQKLLIFVLTPVVLIIYINSEQLIVLLLSNKWIDTVKYFQLLLPVVLLYPLINIGMTVFQIIGKTDTFLKVEFITKILGLIILFLTFKDVKTICIGISILFLLQFIIVDFVSKRSLKTNDFSTIKFLIINILLVFILIYILEFFTLNNFIQSIIVLVVYVLVNLNVFDSIEIIKKITNKKTK